MPRTPDFFLNSTDTSQAASELEELRSEKYSVILHVYETVLMISTKINLY